MSVISEGLPHLSIVAASLSPNSLLRLEFGPSPRAWHGAGTQAPAPLPVTGVPARGAFDARGWRKVHGGLPKGGV